MSVETPYTVAVRKRLAELQPRHPSASTACACIECVLFTLVETGLGQIEYDAAELASARAKLEQRDEALLEAIEIIEDAWNQWAYTNGRGERIAGGLSALEWIEEALPRLRAVLAARTPEGCPSCRRENRPRIKCEACGREAVSADTPEDAELLPCDCRANDWVEGDNGAIRCVQCGGYTGEPGTSIRVVPAARTPNEGGTV